MAEILMSQAEFEEIRQRDYCKSREEFVNMLALGKAYFTSRARVLELEAELAKIKSPEYSRPQQGNPMCRANGVVIR